MIIRLNLLRIILIKTFYYFLIIFIIYFKKRFLILIKTFRNCSNKEFIQASNLTAAAPVLFIRKPGSSFHFYYNYQFLNAIPNIDRYSLPLIKETFKVITKAK